MLKFKIPLYIYTVHQIVWLERDCFYEFTIISWKLKDSRCFSVLVVTMTTETFFYRSADLDSKFGQIGRALTNFN